MYDTQITVAILERLGEVIRDLTKHPGMGLLLVVGLGLVIWWVTRK
jgi:hypothetical protein